nr:hypothetical protein GCM10017745_33430 [Saccharothrix mutabilis subsp. capreolus]
MVALAAAHQRVSPDRPARRATVIIARSAGTEDNQMHRPALSAALQAFASIELTDAVYVACPISSGRRELELMLAAAEFDRAVLRARLVDRWARQVLEPNRRDARAAARRARARYPEHNVVNPSEFDIEGLDQPGYDQLCERIIRGHVGRIVLADGWELSRARGSRRSWPPGWGCPWRTPPAIG